VRNSLPGLRDEYNADFVIVNGENAAAGYGVTAGVVTELMDAGADCITTGNHVWAHREAGDLLERNDKVLRPANYPPDSPGLGANVYRTQGDQKVGVINLLGRVFMDAADCPFRVGRGLVEQVADDCDAILVDFHAEATSEKAAMAFYLDGLVTAVMGTHTHVQTADEQILPKGTAFISDVGMTGPAGTIIGVKPEIVIRRFLSGMPVRFEVPKGGPAMLSAVLIETIPGAIYANAIRRLQILTDSADEVS